MSPWHAVLTGVTHAPPVPIAVPMQSAHGSVSELTVPGVKQYSVAHLVAQPPVALQTQLAMSWKYVVLPPAQPFWQQSTHLFVLSPWHVLMPLVVSVQVPPPLLLPEELPLLEPLLEPLELPLLDPLLEPLELPLLDPLLLPEELPLPEPLLEPLELPLLDPLLEPLLEPLELPLLEPLLDPLELPLEPPVSPEVDASPPPLPPSSPPPRV